MIFHSHALVFSVIFFVCICQGMHPLERELQGEESRLPRFKQKAEEVKVHNLFIVL